MDRRYINIYLFIIYYLNLYACASHFAQFLKERSFVAAVLLKLLYQGWVVQSPIKLAQD